MGWLARLFGRRSGGETETRPPRAAGRGRAAAPSKSWKLSADMTLLSAPEHFGQAVVGESHYQPALRRAANGRAADVSGGDFSRAIQVTARLVPEPDNPYDSSAVAVVVDDELVGHLARDVARVWHPVLAELWDGGRCVSCEAGISGGGSRFYGIFLRVCEPEHVAFLGRAPEWAMPLAGMTSVTVTGEERHQDVLASHAGSDTVLATLHPCAVGKGKYRGEQTLEVRIEDQRVGELTRAMGRRYLPLVTDIMQAGKVAMCRATVGEDHRGRQVALLLPSERALSTGAR